MPAKKAAKPAGKPAVKKSSKVSKKSSQRSRRTPSPAHSDVGSLEEGLEEGLPPVIEVTAEVHHAPLSPPVITKSVTKPVTKPATEVTTSERDSASPHVDVVTPDADTQRGVDDDDGDDGGDDNRGFGPSEDRPEKQAEMVLEWVRETEMLWNQKSLNFKQKDKKERLWEDKAAEVGVSSKYKNYILYLFNIMTFFMTFFSMMTFL
jgi:hypothetical protein